MGISEICYTLIVWRCTILGRSRRRKRKEKGEKERKERGDSEGTGLMPRSYSPINSWNAFADKTTTKKGKHRVLFCLFCSPGWSLPPCFISVTKWQSNIQICTSISQMPNEYLNLKRKMAGDMFLTPCNFFPYPALFFS